MRLVDNMRLVTRVYFLFVSHSRVFLQDMMKEYIFHAEMQVQKMSMYPGECIVRICCMFHSYDEFGRIFRKFFEGFSFFLVTFGWLLSNM